MNQITEALVTIAVAIIGVAILSVIVSNKSNTVGVIQAAASGFSNSLATAMSPVTGAEVNINTSYPQSGGGGGASPSRYASGLNFNQYPSLY